MESGPGSRGVCHSRSTGLRCPLWSRRTRSLQGALMFIIFTTHFQWAASERNQTLKSPSLNGAWNKTLYKTEHKCLHFHDDKYQSFFYYWPEDDPHFDHCCVSPDQALYELATNFTYGTFGPNLGYTAYYDLGLIDKCLPYWRCIHLFHWMYETNIYLTSCEFTDLRRFYKHRFWTDTVLKRSLLQSAIPFVLSSEILVIFSVALYWFIWRRTHVNASWGIVIDATKAWLRSIRRTLIMDWTHLYLLTVIGNGLIEAVGRQNPYDPISKAFYNYGRLYVVLSILVWYSSVLSQISYWIAESEVSYKAALVSPSTAVPSARVSSSLDSQPSVPMALKEEIGLSDDWKWQPISAQAGILFCLWGFLTYSSSDNTSGAVFGIIVSAACPWSGLYASKVIIHTFRWLLQWVYRNLIKRSDSKLWPNVVLWKRWPRPQGNGGAAGGHAQPEDSAAILELEDKAYPPVQNKRDGSTNRQFLSHI